MSEQFGYAKGTSGKSYKGNAMTPLNWAAGVFETLLIPIGASQHHNWAGIACFSMAAFILIGYFCIFCYFAITDPNRLQTEEFNLAQMTTLSTHPGDKISFPSQQNNPVNIASATLPEKSVNEVPPHLGKSQL